MSTRIHRKPDEFKSTWRTHLKCRICLVDICSTYFYCFQNRQKGKKMNAESIAEKLTQEIRVQESLHAPLVKDLAKLAASTAVTEEDFHTTFLKTLGRYANNSYPWDICSHFCLLHFRSGIETRLQNAVFHLLRTKGSDHWALHSHQTRRQEPLAYMIKIQVSLSRRVPRMCLRLTFD